MAFITGKYIASGNDILDAHIIAKESYQASYDYVAINTWTDASGAEHEEYYPNRRLLVNFNTSDMDETTLTTFLNWFKNHYVSGTKDIVITAWVPNEATYITQRCKVTGISPIIDMKYHNGHVYKAMTIALEGRGCLS